MILWHLGATIALSRYTFRDERMDLRFLAFGALLPDLIDTPSGLIGFSIFGAMRLFGHSLLFAGVIMAAILFTTRRGRPRKKWMPVAIGVLIHLFLDAMWASPETLWWPFLGLDFTPAGAADVAEYMGNVIGNSWVWLGEIAGALYLGILAKRANLGAAPARHLLRSTGRIEVPIGASDG